jgi:butyrate kinase
MTETDPLILVINPGSTSTKVAIFSGENEIHSESVEHSINELNQFDLTAEQFDLRRENIETWLRFRIKIGHSQLSPDAVHR